LPIPYYQTSFTNGSSLHAGDTANVSDLELVKNTPILWRLGVFCYVGRDWVSGWSRVANIPFKCRTQKRHEYWWLWGLFFTDWIFPKTPTEKSPFNGNEESGWSLKHGQEKNRHIL
jgi:hypothetical protein